MPPDGRCIFQFHVQFNLLLGRIVLFAIGCVWYFMKLNGARADGAYFFQQFSNLFEHVCMDKVNRTVNRKGEKELSKLVSESMHCWKRVVLFSTLARIPYGGQENPIVMVPLACALKLVLYYFTRIGFQFNYSLLCILGQNHHSRCTVFFVL